MTDNQDETEQIELTLLDSLLQDSALISQIDFDLANDLLLSDHRALWRAMVELHGEGIKLPDRVLLAEHAGVSLLLVSNVLASGAIPGNFPRYLQQVQKLARERRIRRLGEQLTIANPADFPGIIEHLGEQRTELSGKCPRRLEDIPEIQLLDIPPADYIVPALGIARNTITLWTGEDGSGKTILAQAMSAAVAQGQSFLGMRCQQCPVLYLDLENPGYVVQARIRVLLGERRVPHFRAWGTWNEIQPPQYGNPQLLSICKEKRPLVIVDPLLYFHDHNEDSSTEMAPVMKYLRAIAVCGGAVVILHHPAKSENSKGRGSSAIRAGCDLAFMHSLDKGANVITLKVDKNRHGERREFTINADFDECRFEPTQAAWLKSRNDEIAHLQELISKSPGISSNQLVLTAGGRKRRMLKLLEEGAGTCWIRERGPRNSKLFFPTEGSGSWFPSKEGEPGNQSRNALMVPGTSGNQSEPGTSTHTRATRESEIAFLPTNLLDMLDAK